MTEWLAQDQTNGMLIGPDGCHYPNEHQAAHYGVLNLCGCGEPVEAYNFCREALACFDRRGNGDWMDAEASLKDLICNHPAQAAHVLAHLFTHLNLLDHGGSVGGSWLTEDGTRIIDMGPATEELLGES